MKYTRLTKEQLEELHQEFINFLATQSITGEEWKQIKEKQPEFAEQELDIFSDLIWEGVLSKDLTRRMSVPEKGVAVVIATPWFFILFGIFWWVGPFLF